MSYESDWMSPVKLGQGFVTLGKELLKPTAGDISALVSLFFDNLSTIIGFSGIWLYVIAGGDFATDTSFVDGKEIFYQRILPGLGLSLFYGNFYYSWMAARMKNQCARERTRRLSPHAPAHRRRHTHPHRPPAGTAATSPRSHTASTPSAASPSSSILCSAS